MKTVAYSCPFVPCEWIAAHGLRPRRISPGPPPGPPAGPSEGLCPYVQAFVHAAGGDARAEAVVVTTLCDQMRRAAEWIARSSDRRVFRLNVPATWQGREPRRLYTDEVRRLGRFLQRLGGRPPSAEELAAVMCRYDDLRGELRAARPRLPARRFAERVLAAASGEVPEGGDVAPSRRGGVPVALVGGALRRCDLGLFDLLERSGGRVVLDATDTGERTLPAPFDRRRLARDPLGALVDAYFGAIPHVFRRPNEGFYQYLIRELHVRGARAVLFRRYPWCDTWNAELWRLRDRLDLPVFELDIGTEAGVPDRWATRVQAMLEALS